jgi:hypothetical protein
MRRIFPLALVVGMLVPASGFSQNVSALRVGTRARVVTDRGATHTGTLTSVSENALTLVPARHPEQNVVLSMTEVSRIQVSTGRNRAKGALFNGLIGLGLGAAGGAALGALTYEDSSSCSFICLSRGESAQLGGILGGGAGLIVGAITGAVTGREKWADVPPSRTR